MAKPRRNAPPGSILSVYELLLCARAHTSVGQVVFLTGTCVLFSFPGVGGSRRGERQARGSPGKRAGKRRRGRFFAVYRLLLRAVARTSAGRVAFATGMKVLFSFPGVGGSLRGEHHERGSLAKRRAEPGRGTFLEGKVGREGEKVPF